MKIRMVVLSLALCLLGVATCFAEDVQIGTWKLNEAKSKFSPGAVKTKMAVYEVVGDNVKVTADGDDGTGKPTHSEWTGKFDGKDYPVTGNPNLDARSYKKVNDHTLAISNKKDGKVVESGRIVVSDDGKSRTLTIKGTDSEGKKTTSTQVFDKQ
jgi:hypothetical protein